jgi:hypothetical protein
MIITKIIIVFLLIIAIIILLNKKYISEHLTSTEAIDNYLNYIDNRIKSRIEQKLSNSKLMNICIYQIHLVKMIKILYGLI